MTVESTIQSWVDRHPEWFVEARLELEITSSGWDDLVDEALTFIDGLLRSSQAIDFRVLQIKQKLGAGDLRSGRST